MCNLFYSIGVSSTVYTIVGEVPTSVHEREPLPSPCRHLLRQHNAVLCRPLYIHPRYGNLEAKIGFVFGVFILGCVLLVDLFLFETRMRTYEKLDELFMNRVPTRQSRLCVTLAERHRATLTMLRKTTYEYYI